MGKIAAFMAVVLFFNFSISMAADSYQPTFSAGEGDPRSSYDQILDISTDITNGRESRWRTNEIANRFVAIDIENDDVDEVGVLFSDGTMKILSLKDNSLHTVLTIRNLSPESPPVAVPYLGGEPTGGLLAIDDRGDLVSIDVNTGRTQRLSGGFSPVSRPTAADLDGDGNLEIAAVSDEGEMTIVRGRGLQRSDNTTVLLPDTGIVASDLDGDGTIEIIALSSPTDIFQLGRLGDDLEAAGLAVFEWNGKLIKLKDEYALPEGKFFETLVPALDHSDKSRVGIILVVTQEGKGSVLQSFSYSNGRLRPGRTSPEVPFENMLHLIGCAELGEERRMYVVASVLGGEVDGDLELYRPDMAQRRTVLKSCVFTHEIGSRTIETVLIADFNGDGIPEILAPSDDMSDLSMFSLVGSLLRSYGIYSGSRRITSNLCSGEFDGSGRSDVVFGLEDGTIIVLEGQ